MKDSIFTLGVTTDTFKRGWFRCDLKYDFEYGLSKQFIDLSIKKYPQIESIIFTVIIREHSPEIGVYFPDCSLQDVVVAIEKYRKKID